MKARAVVSAVVVLVAASCGYASGHVEVIGPPQQGFYFSVTVDAASGPKGTASFYRPGLQSAMGQVTCLAIEGNRATVGIDNDLYPDTPAGALIFVEDNGRSDGVDVVNATFVDEVPTTCVPPTDQDLDVWPGLPGLESVYSGDISVGVLAVSAGP